jgi:hypothetical protein
VGRVDYLGDGLAGSEVFVRAAGRARILFWLAFALPGPCAEFLLLRELAQDLHVHACRALIEDIWAAGRDLHNAGGRAGQLVPGE